MTASSRRVGNDEDLKDYILDTINRLETLVSRLEVYADGSGEAHAEQEDDSAEGNQATG